MKQEAFLTLLSRFAERPLPAVKPATRHVYVWHGEADRLVRALPGWVLRTLDLHALAAGLGRAPRAVDSARRLLLGAIRDEMPPSRSGDGQTVLIVTGCDLLSRYQVPLTPLFEAASDRTAVVLIVAPAEMRFQPQAPLPEYVELNPRAPLEYLRVSVGPEAVIDTLEELS